MSESTELTVLDRVTGELLSVHTATTESLAAYVDNLRELRSQLAEQEEIVQRELLERLDKAAQWTERAGDFELKAPSPTAGTEVYNPAVLEDVLQTLIMSGTVGETAATGALARTLVIEVTVPWCADPEEMQVKLTGAVNIHVAGVSVQVVRCTPVRKPSVAGVNRLRKLTGVGEALDRAREEPIASPRRRVKITYRGRPS